MIETRLQIEGMTCGHCVARVRGMLEQVPGVEIVELQLGSARVRYPEGSTTPEEIAQALSDDGYRATPQPLGD